jgi:hypothetical protein
LFGLGVYKENIPMSTGFGVTGFGVTCRSAFLASTRRL